MKYETPKLTVLVPAINAIQGSKQEIKHVDAPLTEEVGPAYADWE